MGKRGPEATINYEALVDVHRRYHVPLARLADISGLTRAAVYNYLNRKGIDYERYQGKPIFGEEDQLQAAAEIRRVYGVPLGLLATLLNVTQGGLSMVLNDGVYGDQIPKHQREAIRAAYDAGLTQAQIGTLTGRAQTTISKIVNEDG